MQRRQSGPRVKISADSFIEETLPDGVLFYCPGRRHPGISLIMGGLLVAPKISAFGNISCFGINRAMP